LECFRGERQQEIDEQRGVRGRIAALVLNHADERGGAMAVALQPVLHPEGGRGADIGEDGILVFELTVR
jgi:hypothetical protein